VDFKTLGCIHETGLLPQAFFRGDCIGICSVNANQLFIVMVNVPEQVNGWQVTLHSSIVFRPGAGPALGIFQTCWTAKRLSFEPGTTFSVGLTLHFASWNQKRVISALELEIRHSAQRLWL
jgi:hypothetical protein